MKVAEYLSWFEDVVGPTERIFRSVPPEKIDWKLTETSFSMGQILSHIPRAISFMTKVLNHDELPLKSLREIMLSNRRQPSATVDEALADLSAATARFKAVVRGIPDEMFAVGMLDTPQLGKVQYWRYAAFVLEHHIHHLMELHLCLKALGVKVNTGTLYSRPQAPSSP